MVIPALRGLSLLSSASRIKFIGFLHKPMHFPHRSSSSFQSCFSLLKNTLTNSPSLFTSGFCSCYSFSSWNTAPDPLVIFSFYVFCFSDLFRTSKSGIYLGNPNHILHWLDPSTVLCAWLCFKAVKAWTCEGQVCGMKMRQVRLGSLIGDLQMWI